MRRWWSSALTRASCPRPCPGDPHRHPRRQGVVQVGAQRDEQTDVTVEVTAAVARKLNSLGSDDPNYQAARDRVLSSGERRVNGDPLPLGGRLSKQITVNAMSENPLSWKRFTFRRPRRSGQPGPMALARAALVQASVHADLERFLRSAASRTSRRFPGFPPAPSLPDR
jgi:hypothetical protein